MSAGAQRCGWAREVPSTLQSEEQSVLEFPEVRETVLSPCPKGRGRANLLQVGCSWTEGVLWETPS